MIKYKLYKREEERGRWRCLNKMPSDFLRKCEKHGKLWYTIQWWSKQEDDSWKKRRNKKYVPGVKFIKNISRQKAEEMLFLGAL